MDPYWLGMLVGLIEGIAICLFSYAIILIYRKERENDETFLEK